jgi:hypothetical protein
MKKLFVTVVLASGLAACGSRKADTTPRPVETNATGGAAYGGATYGGAKSANPCAGSAAH